MIFICALSKWLYISISRYNEEIVFHSFFHHISTVKSWLLLVYQVGHVITEKPANIDNLHTFFSFPVVNVGVIVLLKNFQWSSSATVIISDISSSGLNMTWNIRKIWRYQWQWGNTKLLIEERQTIINLRKTDN